MAAVAWGVGMWNANRADGTICGAGQISVVRAGYALIAVPREFQWGAIHLTQVAPAYSILGYGDLSRTCGRLGLPS